MSIKALTLKNLIFYHGLSKSRATCEQILAPYFAVTEFSSPPGQGPAASTQRILVNCGEDDSQLLLSASVSFPSTLLYSLSYSPKRLSAEVLFGYTVVKTFNTYC